MHAKNCLSFVNLAFRNKSTNMNKKTNKVVDYEIHQKLMEMLLDQTCITIIARLTYYCVSPEKIREADLCVCVLAGWFWAVERMN